MFCCGGSGSGVGGGGVWNDEDLPPGFRFRPTDEELVSYYLKKKLENQPLPKVNIPEINVYSDSPDKLIIGQYKELAENHWYFFSTRDRKYPNGTRPDRKAGNGFWKAIGKSDSIVVDGNLLGEKRTLVYYKDGRKNSRKSEWMMHEYKSNNINSSHKKTDENDMRLDDVVLYKIYINCRSTKKAAQEKNVDESRQIDDGSANNAPIARSEEAYALPRLLPSISISSNSDNNENNNNNNYGCQCHDRQYYYECGGVGEEGLQPSAYAYMPNRPDGDVHFQLPPPEAVAFNNNNSYVYRVGWLNENEIFFDQNPTFPSTKDLPRPP